MDLNVLDFLMVRPTENDLLSARAPGNSQKEKGQGRIQGEPFEQEKGYRSRPFSVVPSLLSLHENT